MASRRIAMSRKVLILTMFVLVYLARAFAQSDIVYVSYNGADTHPCTRTSPCQTITHALSVVNAGGQVSIIGSGTYDSFVVSKAVTVAAEPGVTAVLDGTNGGLATVVYVAAGPGDSVVLRRLNVYGTPSTVGVGIVSAGTVSVEDCVARAGAPLDGESDFSTFYVVVKGGTYTAPLAGDQAITLCCNGINSPPPSATIDGVTLEGGAQGLWTDASLVTITNSVLSGTRPGTGTAGIYVLGGTVISENNVISDFDTGVAAPGGPVFLSSNTIAGNTTGVYAPNVFTRGNNTIVGNGQNVNGTMTSFSGQ
jgi:hypothetical protein